MSLTDVPTEEVDNLDWQSAYDDAENFTESNLDRSEWNPGPFKEIAHRITIEGE